MYVGHHISFALGCAGKITSPTDGNLIARQTSETSSDARRGRGNAGCRRQCMPPGTLRSGLAAAPACFSPSPISPSPTPSPTDPQRPAGLLQSCKCGTEIAGGRLGDRITNSAAEISFPPSDRAMPDHTAPEAKGDGHVVDPMRRTEEPGPDTRQPGGLESWVPSIATTVVGGGGCYRWGCCIAARRVMCCCRATPRLSLPRDGVCTPSTDLRMHRIVLQKTELLTAKSPS